MGTTIRKMSFWSKRFMGDSVTAMYIFLLPILLYAHLWVDPNSKTFTLWGFAYPHGFGYTVAFVWHGLSMLIPLVLFLIWFYNTRSSWRYAILSPLLLFLYCFFWHTLSLQVQWVVGLFFLCLLILLLLDRSFGKLAGPHSRGYGSLRTSLAFNTQRIYERIVTFFRESQTSRSQREDLQKLLQIQLLLDREVKDNIKMPHRIKKTKISIQWLWILLLLCVPFLYHIYHLVPQGEKKYTFLGIVFSDHGFSDVNSFIWYINMKLCVLLPLCIWFLSATYWWRYAILSPIILYTYQILELFLNSSNEVDRYELIKSIPAIFILVGVLLFLSKIIKYQSKLLDLHQEVNGEIELLLSQMEHSNNSLTEKKREFGALQGTRVTKETSQEHMQSLLALRKALLREMEKQNPD